MAPAVVMPYDSHRDIPELLVITSSAEINGSLFCSGQRYCSLTIEPGVQH
jgi:hypothetical protein